MYGDEWSNGQCRVMGLESTLALMAAAMLGSSNGESNMDLDSTISGFFLFSICYLSVQML